MVKAYRYRLCPTASQREFFEKSFGCARYVYNWALNMRIEAYQQRKERLSCVDLCKMLTHLKKDEDKLWLNEVSNECLQQSIRNMDSAFTRFFREKKGFPKFKSKKDGRKSYKAINSVQIDFDIARIKLPNFNIVEYKEKGKIKTYIMSDMSGLYKIGRSRDLDRRYMELKIGNPSIKIEFAFEGDYEKELHEKYGVKNRGGEWFALTEKDLEEIKRIYYVD